ncbi:protocadherin-like wing polarity protein stan isoform X2 [Aricia agestis]|uniref:protocadherin-like wing polarity protein stan isoform X2 n=1 Tax=Aricia agestis TaxID=91739 RepID=UPI001C20BF42|nr:protocadherin-like wing polarity protein stan isoform X2 [Aricia agestis]
MAALLGLAALLLTAASANSQAIQDSRCYLMNGGAVESFFVSEDTPVGSVIGTLSVNGSPGEDGDITLRVQERGAAVDIAPGSKNITLRRALDREERSGPASVYINVRCDRRHTTDPSFVIPVSVRVWDVNDNAPAWAGAPYRARVSELAAVGTRVLSAPATDPDQPGPHATVRYSVLPGPYSDLVGFASELDSTVVVRKPLDFEKVRNFTVTLRAADGGAPPRENLTTLRVDIMDADDQNPRFSHDHYTAVLPPDAVEGTILETSPGPISAVDQDLGINAPLYYEARVEGASGEVTGEGEPLLRMDRDTGRAAVTRRLLTQTLPVTVVIKATQVDNADRYALATLTVRPARGAGPPPSPSPAGVQFMRRAYSALVPEDTKPGAVLTSLQTSQAEKPLQFYVSERSFLEKFAINSAGEVLLRHPLDYEARANYQYQVMVTDGQGNDTAAINITVGDVNEWEPRFRHAHYEFGVTLGDGEDGGDGRGAGDKRVGRLQAHDGDSGDRLTIQLSGPDSKYFYADEDGTLYLRGEMAAAVNATALHLVATAVDSGSPPRQSSVPVVVRVRGGAGARAETARAGGAVLGGFSAALALLAVALLGLLVYLCRLRRRQAPLKSPAPASEGGEKAGSLLSVSAGASSILAASCSSLDRDPPTTANKPRSNGKSRVAPAAPVAALSDHVSGGGVAGRSGVAWPSATIPARVKKLSWDDAPSTDETGAGVPRDVTEATNTAVGDHMNLTVYF